MNRKTSALIIAALLVSALPAQSLRAVAVYPLAQVPQVFPLPESVPAGTQVRISSGSDSTNQIAEALGSSFEAQYPGSSIEIASQEKTAAALQDVLSGNADLAAINRPLTAAETADGLIEVPVLREKIAIAVGQDNPFTQSLTVSQFAQIFRGEITDWSEVGGPAGPIRVVDRPDSSEIRQALRPYPVFATSDFTTGENAIQLTEDSTEALAAAVGSDGIGYAPVAQLENQPTLRALELHQTPPTNPQYPFSQSYSFVYAGGALREIADFLGYATGEPGQTALSQVNLANSEEGAVIITAANGEATAAAGTTIDENSATPEREGTIEETDFLGDQSALADGGYWWWLLLPLAGLGLFIWAAASRSSEEETAYAAPVDPEDETIRSPLDSERSPNATVDDSGFSPPEGSEQATYATNTDLLNSDSPLEKDEEKVVPSTNLPAVGGGVSSGESTLTSNIEEERRDTAVDLDSASSHLIDSSTNQSAASEDSPLEVRPRSHAVVQPEPFLEQDESSWLDRAKNRIIEATDQTRESPPKDDLHRDA